MHLKTIILVRFSLQIMKKMHRCVLLRGRKPDNHTTPRFSIHILYDFHYLHQIEEEAARVFFFPSLLAIRRKVGHDETFFPRKKKQVKGDAGTLYTS